MRFAVHFADLVTRRTEHQNSKIARCGVCSIYGLLKSMRLAVALRTNSGPRDELSEVESNKSLQVL